MKRAFVLAIGSIVVALLSVGVALATPATGATAQTVGRATFDAINANHTAGRDAVIQSITVAPGGYTGWHSHNGPTVVLVQSGTFTVYHGPEHGNPHAAKQCEGTDTAAGRGFVEEADDPHLGRNNSATETVNLTVVYLDVPAGGAVRKDEAAPACAAAAGLTTGSAVSGITSAPVLSRANFTTGASITNADERDVFVQQTTFAPGGHSGWHSHPGAAVVFVKSGDLTIYGTDCKAQKFSAGQGTIEEPGHVFLGRNEGTVPLVLYGAFFDVPVGGSNRIDQPEPATCKGLAAVPAAVTAPDTAAVTSTAQGGVLPALAGILLVLSLASLLALRVTGARRRG